MHTFLPFSGTQPSAAHNSNETWQKKIHKTFMCNFESAEWINVRMHERLVGSGTHEAKKVVSARMSSHCKLTLPGKVDPDSHLGLSGM